MSIENTVNLYWGAGERQYKRKSSQQTKEQNYCRKVFQSIKLKK